MKIEIDDDLLAAAMAASGLPTKRATVEEGLRLLVRLHDKVEAFERLIVEPTQPKSLLALLAILSPLDEDFPPIPDSALGPVET